MGQSMRRSSYLLITEEGILKVQIHVLYMYSTYQPAREQQIFQTQGFYTASEDRTKP
jgi:hypothetical protein